MRTQYVYVIERYTTASGEPVIHHFCYGYGDNWICLVNSQGKVVKQVLNVACMGDVDLITFVLDWHRRNVAPPRAKLDWEYFTI